MTTTTERPTERKPRGPWTSPAAVASIAFLLLLVVAGVWLAATSPSKRPAHPAVARPVGCGPAAGTQTPLSLAPPTTWRLVGSMAAPGSPGHGPARTVNGVPACFSPDPTGALFTAATFAAAMTSPPLRPVAVRQMVAPGPARDAALRLLAGNPGTVTVGEQIAGFAFLDYSPARSATVDLALTLRGAYLHTPVHLLWMAGDWRIVLAPDGHPFDGLTALPGLNGYTFWQGA